MWPYPKYYLFVEYCIELAKKPLQNVLTFFDSRKLANTIIQYLSKELWEEDKIRLGDSNRLDQFRTKEHDKILLYNGGAF